MPVMHNLGCNRRPSSRIYPMPIYEYRCGNCHRKVSLFWRSIRAVDEAAARCTYCGSGDLSKLMPRVRVIRGGGAGSERADPTAGGDDIDDSIMNEMGGLDENDPRALGRFMRKMAAESGESIGPEFDEIVGRLEKGEDPEKIEQSMGDLFGEPGGDMMDDEMGAPPAPPSDNVGEETAGDQPAAKRAQRTVRRKTHPAPGAAKPKSKRRKSG